MAYIIGIFSFGKKEIDWLGFIGVFFCICFIYKELFSNVEFYCMATVVSLKSLLTHENGTAFFFVPRR